MYIIGTILTICGFITSIIGIGNRQSAIESYYGYGRYYNKGNISDAELTITIGIVLIFIGLLIILVRYLKKDKKSVDKKMDWINTKKCLKCGNVVKSNVHYCGICGNDIVNQGI